MEALRELEARIAQHPPDRYPVQNATASFHLGSLLADAGRGEEAAAVLTRAIDLFGRARMEVERAKALNALGAALRVAGREPEAEGPFREAAAAFASAGLAAEEGAALHNLGLVTRDPERFRGARTRFAAAGETRHEAAALRELGVLHLEAAEPEEAVSALVESVELAERAGDLAGLGAAANALGLAQLALGDASAAIGSFRSSAGAHGRGVRPAEHAAAKANLALAHERAGDASRARLAARQALSVGAAPAPARALAEAVLSRLPAASGDLVAVLADEPEERRLAVAREEVVRWAEAPPEDRRREAAAFAAAATADLLEPLLGALLELPPDGLDAVASELAADADERFRRAFERAAVRYPTPQLLRLRQAFGWS